MKSKRGAADSPQVSLLEYDERFDVFPEFVRYDFREPLKLPSQYSAVSPTKRLQLRLVRYPEGTIRPPAS